MGIQKERFEIQRLRNETLLNSLAGALREGFHKG